MYSEREETAKREDMTRERGLTSGKRKRGEGKRREERKKGGG